MKKYIDESTGEKVVEVRDLSYLKDRNHPYNWFQRHYHHHRLRIALRRADRVLAENDVVATDLVRYYFVPKSKITLGLSHKA